MYYAVVWQHAVYSEGYADIQVEHGNFHVINNTGISYNRAIKIPGRSYGVHVNLL
jgi:hypothetical protein